MKRLGATLATVLFLTFESAHSFWIFYQNKKYNPYIGGLRIREAYYSALNLLFLYLEM